MIWFDKRDVFPIADYSVEQFCYWLSDGIIEYLKLEAKSEKSESAKDFELDITYLGPNAPFWPLNVTINRFYPLFDNLFAIYNALANRSIQRRFRIGLGRAIAGLPRQIKYTEALILMLRLTGATGALEALPGIEAQVTNSYYTMHEDTLLRKRIHLFTMNAVSEMSVREVDPETEKLYSCLLSIIKSPNFLPGLSDRALKTLCEVRPHCLTHNLELLRNHICDLYFKGIINFENLEGLAWQVAEAIPLPTLVKQLPHILLPDHWIIKQLINNKKAANRIKPYTDFWLAMALFLSPNPPLLCFDFQAESDRFMIAKSIDSKTMVPFDVRGEDDVFWHWYHILSSKAILKYPLSEIVPRVNKASDFSFIDNNVDKIEPSGPYKEFEEGLKTLQESQPDDDIQIGSELNISNLFQRQNNNISG